MEVLGLQVLVDLGEVLCEALLGQELVFQLGLGLG